MIGWAELAQVVGGGVGAFGTCHAEARHIALRIVEIVVADPGERQIGEHLVAVGQPVEGDGVARGAIERCAAQHHALRAPRRAGGVENDRGFGALAGVDTPIEIAATAGSASAARPLAVSASSGARPSAS